jgi:general stress protein CsbA
LLIQFSLRYKNWYDSKWPQMADIVFNQMQELIRQEKNTNYWNSFHSDTRIDTTVNEHKRLISENCISNLCPFTAVSILLPDWKLYHLFVIIYCRINYCIWLKTILTLFVHLLSYQFFYLSENCISNLCSFTVVSFQSDTIIDTTVNDHKKMI